MVGIVVGLLLAIEGAYRLQGAVKRMRAGEEPIALESGADWMSAYVREHKAAIEGIGWEPYAYYRAQPFAGAYVNIDAAGRRRTVQEDLPAGTPEVFLFGGSTLFGSYQRDDWTLPSRLARRFATCSGQKVKFVNFGVSGRVLTQELVELLLQLRQGTAPRVVLFYDGINDVAAAIQNGRPGWPQNEGNRSRDFELGRRVFWWEGGALAEFRAYGYLALASLSRLQFLQRLQPFSVPGPLPAPPANGASSQALVASYAGTVRVIEALSKEFGFVPLYVWQPTIHSTGKALTSGEAVFLQELQGSQFGRQLVALHREAAASFSAPVPGLPPTRFVNLSAALDGERGPVFADGIGHTYESANDVLARALAPHLVRSLDEAGIEVGCEGLP